jgi:crossover junction endodeoxyribonuclease RusA
MSDIEVRFAVPTPPSTNNLYANAQGKGRVKSERYRTWLNAAGWSVRAALGGHETISTAVCVGLQVPDDRRRDIDNFCKATLDLLVHMKVIEDDKIVERLVVERAKRPDVLVTLALMPSSVRDAA